MKHLKRTSWWVPLLTLLVIILAACTPTAKPTSPVQGTLPVTGERQLVLEPLDHLKRAVGAHIQLRYQDKPTEERESRINVDPVGWHNYKFAVDDTGKESWLMNRGHLVGYQFSGLNDELRNLTPMTAYLNTGALSGTDKTNPAGMLYYEERLARWLKDHPDNWLDYQVTPVYDGNELIPRQVKLRYVGLTSDGTTIPITFGTTQESQDDTGVTTATLDNTSSNARIDYLTGEAIPVAEVLRESTSQQASDRTVYVANNGNSDVYWYDKSRMPSRTNQNNVVEMTESQAQSMGKTHSTKE